MELAEIGGTKTVSGYQSTDCNVVNDIFAESGLSQEYGKDFEGSSSELAEPSKLRYATETVNADKSLNQQNNFEETPNIPSGEYSTHMTDTNSITSHKKEMDGPSETNIQDVPNNEIHPKLSSRSSLVLSPAQLENVHGVTRRRMISNENNAVSAVSAVESQELDEEDQEWKKKPHYERRKIFNIAKHIVSIFFIILDVVLDWVEYSEMNKRGNYSIVAERRIKNVEFTFECQTTGESVQFIFMIFTIIGTVLSALQIFNIGYQMHYEFKGVYENKRLVHEYVETFMFLLFIEISQILLIMGFYDVCTLDCFINGTEILILLNGISSFFKICWRFFTSWKFCTVHLTTRVITKSQRNRTQRQPSRPTSIQHRTPTMQKGCCDSCESCTSLNSDAKCCIYVLLFTFLPCIGYTSSLVAVWESRKLQTKRDYLLCSPQRQWKCQKSCKCCTLRCFPSRFDAPDTNACDCTCKKCLSCEQICKCCTLRCFPAYLDHPKVDSCDCTCRKCMRCEKMCGCCVLRCCPSYLDPPNPDICTCRCAECMSCKLPCKCFTFRCFPEYLDPPHPDICTCRCAECISFQMPCKCFIFRCFPQYLDSPHPDICTCRCGECMSCERPCKCFIARCFPQHLNPPKSNWFDCICGECIKCSQGFGCCILRCAPSYLDPPENDICTCRCREFLSCQQSCKCCILRCFPTFLRNPQTKWCDCICGNCMKCKQVCGCCILRCFPSHLDPPDDNYCTCIFRECASCEKNCFCCLCRCFPTTLDPSKPDAFECTCGKCLACERDCSCCKFHCCPSHLHPKKDKWCECNCCNKPRPDRIAPAPRPPPRQLTPITTQPVQMSVIVIPGPPIQRTPTPLPPQPPRPREPVCKKCCQRFIYFLVGIVLLLIILLLLFYLFLETVQIRYAFSCFSNDALMNTTQQVFVQNYLKLFKL